MEILSYIGTLFTAFASLPQLYYSCKKSDTIAPGSSILRIVAAATWGSWAILSTNISLAVSCSIVFLVECTIFILTKTLGTPGTPGTPGIPTSAP